jgi:N-acetylglucosaminyldiphosphoundecaprenol N-acetyl-beta-D-mannosaminyltransferase
MSSAAQIAGINAADAHFVVVALGARKGQEWIEANLVKIRAPVIGHLGAVVNFIAGTVQRAPAAWQALGLEWLWRIKEEPGLWKRYFSDGLALLGLLFTRLLPHAVLSWTRGKRHEERCEAALQTREEGQVLAIHLYGNWMGANMQPLRNELTRLAAIGRPIMVDLQQLVDLDGALLGLLQLLDGWQRQQTKARSIRNTAAAVQRVFRRYGANYLLQD